MYRRRRSYGPRGAKRPVDKAVVNVYDTSFNTSQTNNAIYTATQAVTFSGARISGSYGSPSTAGSAMLALILVRHGQTVGTLSYTDGSTPYTPEQDILWIKPMQGSPVGGGQVVELSEIIKTKRKMLAGDAIYLSYIASATNLFTIASSVTAFIKQ